MVEVVKTIMEATDSTVALVRNICVCGKILIEIAKTVSRFFYLFMKASKEKTQKKPLSKNQHGGLFDEETD